MAAGVRSKEWNGRRKDRGERGAVLAPSLVESGDLLYISTEYSTRTGIVPVLHPHSMTLT